MKTQNKESKSAVPATVNPDQVLSKVQVEQVNRLNELGKEIIVATGEVALKYLNIVLFIRANKIGPKTVSETLGKLGFKRSRISEINTVANASDKLFSEYEAKRIGFGKAIDYARGEKNKSPELTPAAALLIEEGTLEDRDEKAMLKEAEPTGKKAKKKSLQSRLRDAANLILVNADKEQEWVLRNNKGAVIGKWRLQLVALNPMGEKAD